ncbi:hypothetical protein [Nocardiopsis chromatogenes]|uniref:hypothetical protein n=1 Tax=Nocardiopsis chromatogenes TaxID=280239 RepID=UPI00034864B9|nr:hypothetical protein [Nocardiopsis chromatogenes]
MNTHEQRTCGRPTRSGNPCRVRISGFDVACGTHATDEDRAVAAAYQRGWRQGYEQGRESGASSAQLKIESMERRIRELEQRLDDATRIHEIAGDQVVDVEGYAYRWRGSGRLEVGDRVLLPENYVSRMKHGPGPFVGVVSALGTTYRGALSVIIGRAPETDSEA